MPPAPSPAAAFAGFEAREVPTSRGTVHAMVGGSGPPLLLLHGYPQSHLMWHATAPALAEAHTVVAADLAGYGASLRPQPAGDHFPHSKRALAQDQVEVMAALGFDRFAVAGHDRGGRVAYRWRWTTPSGSSGWRSSTSSPRVRSGDARTATSRGATGTGRSSRCPRRFPSASSRATPGLLDLHVRDGMGLGREPGRYPDEVLAAYRSALDDPGRLEGMCEDYRAGATVDPALDDADVQAGREITCPVLVLWAGRGGLPRFYPDVLDVWRPWAPDVRGGRSTRRTSSPRTAPRRPPPSCWGSSPGAEVAGAPQRVPLRTPGHAVPRPHVPVCFREGEAIDAKL
jgi:haloacetate dehalogenase